MDVGVEGEADGQEGAEDDDDEDDSEDDREGDGESDIERDEHCHEHEGDREGDQAEVDKEGRTMTRRGEDSECPHSGRRAGLVGRTRLGVSLKTCGGFCGEVGDVCGPERPLRPVPSSCAKSAVLTELGLTELALSASEPGITVTASAATVAARKCVEGDLAARHRHDEGWGRRAPRECVGLRLGGPHQTHRRQRRPPTAIPSA